MHILTIQIICLHIKLTLMFLTRIMNQRHYYSITPKRWDLNNDGQYFLGSRLRFIIECFLQLYAYFAKSLNTPFTNYIQDKLKCPALPLGKSGEFYKRINRFFCIFKTKKCRFFYSVLLPRHSWVPSKKIQHIRSSEDNYNLDRKPTSTFRS